ncbi:3-oxoacyl-[acyl-carrier protein] reductase [Actinacidiphila guanduensis]|uniref:3-oxoacyl-[acyl-carrier protein] reductase n=1 Tax=Actinacidiphila guanduensis TaxID=310781 RepID=A0A1H0LB21_9ACTN|nr:3-oxoacyl-[acyl-carrier protein] reductase [Actinacidiphila guanduensis]
MTGTSKRVVITGGSRGIGREIALRFADSGARVVVNYAGNREAADSTVADLRARGVRAVAVQADVADEDGVRSVFDTAEQEFGGVDVVVHAAGVVHRAPLADLDLADLDRVLRTNVRGTFVVDREAVRRLARGGALINFASSVTRFSTPGNSVYTASKAAVEALTLTLSRELRGRGVTVNAVAPGSIATEMLEEYLAGDEDLRRSVAAGSPLGRVGTPGDVAEVVLFLAGPGRWVNGQVVYVNGGAI